MATKFRNVKQIIAIDMVPARLELAKKLGATDVIAASKKDIVDRIKALCPPNGVRYALDCSGNPQAAATMIDSLGTRGRACSVGALAPDLRTSVNIFAHLINGREYVGSHQGESLAKEVYSHLLHIPAAF
ncbi:hypothetical protein NW759_014967 [Fusarium solani]|nr:hypothetical protein NW759_014967 [Fusarium solani]